MNFKEMIVTVGIALLATVAINHFFLSGPSPENGSSKIGQSFQAPLNGQAIKPLRLDVAFQGDEKVADPVLSEVSTPYANMTFSTHGAQLERLQFKVHQENAPITMTTIDALQSSDRMQGAFLVALSEVSPYYYELVENKETENAHELIYQSRSEQCSIQKIFTISKTVHKIDLTIKCSPIAGKPAELRVLYPSPVMPAIAKDDVISGLYVDENGSLKKLARTKIQPNQGWLSVNLFGSENKYFIHSLVQDNDKFVQRAYYKTSCNNLISILEGPAITQPTQWTMSFYMGPKSEEAILPVDKRLEGAVEYSGLLAPLARLLLLVLMFLNSYIHNYGWAIVGITILIKLVLLPFTLRGNKSLKRQAEFQKKLSYIQQKYKHDPEQLNKERAALIAKHGMPGMGGCLPLLLQLPIFIALQRVLSSSIELYRAPFVWIPDLSMSDPYYILPLAIAITMFIQALWSPAAQRPSMLATGLIFGAFSATFSAGLALYLAVNSIFQLIQTMLTGKAA